MGLDYMNLEERAKKNGRAIDSQWIHENEANEMLNLESNGLKHMDVDSDILESMQQTSQNNFNSQSVKSNFDDFANDILGVIDSAIADMDDENEISHGRSR